MGNEPNVFLKETLDLLESRWLEWKEAGKEKRKNIWKTLKKELKTLPCHTGVRGDVWKIKANVSKFNPPTNIWTHLGRHITSGFRTRAE